MLQSTKRVSDFSIASLLQINTATETDRGIVKRDSIQSGGPQHHQEFSCSDVGHDGGSTIKTIFSGDGCFECEETRKTPDFQRSLKKKRRENEEEDETFSWLSCTRFKPPKLPRSKRKSVSRTQGRGPRIPFTSHQLMILEKTFESSQYLSSEMISRLANNLQLTDARVKIWFQNRRARFRRENDLPAPLKPPQLQTHFEYENLNLKCPKRNLQLTPSYPTPAVISNKFSVSENGWEKFDDKLNVRSNNSAQYSRQLINDLNLLTAVKLQYTNHSHV